MKFELITNIAVEVGLILIILSRGRSGEWRKLFDTEISTNVLCFLSGLEEDLVWSRQTGYQALCEQLRYILEFLFEQNGGKGGIIL